MTPTNPTQPVLVVYDSYDDDLIDFLNFDQATPDFALEQLDCADRRAIGEKFDRAA